MDRNSLGLHEIIIKVTSKIYLERTESLILLALYQSLENKLH